MGCAEKPRAHIGVGDGKWLFASFVGERGNFDRFDKYVEQIDDDHAINFIQCDGAHWQAKLF
ncbi:MAG: hypothetical protein LH481_10745 [Burkholderiales bacterium]|nr:hypothetical protein [Burkholderiales bacterium]